MNQISYLKINTVPPSALGSWIEYFIQFEGNGFFRSQVFAQPYAYILFNRNQSLNISYLDKKINSSHSLIEPITTSPFTLAVQLDKPTLLFGAKVKSTFLYLLTGIPLNNLTGNIFNIDELFDYNIDTVLQQIESAPTLSEKAHRAEAFFVERIQAFHTNTSLDNYNAMKYLTHNFYTIFNIDQLLDTLNVSHRTLDRHFLKYTGVSPKMMLSLIRFSKTIEYAIKYHTFTLDTLWNFGYYDYAHFSKDFKKYCGKTFEAFREELKIGENLQVASPQSPILLPEISIY